MRLELMTWPEVEKHLERDRRVVVPCGSTEQHGPTGICGTDFITALQVAREATERAGVVCTPPLAFGMSEHHLAFPGTVSLRPATLQAVIADVARSLHRHGFREVLFVNGHGGNEACLEAAFAQVAEELEGATLRRVNWYELDGVDAVHEELFGDRNGNHATPSEISVTWAVHPEAVRESSPVEIERPDHPWPLSPARFRETFPDGRMESDPSLAGEAHGRRILETAVASLVAMLDRLR